MFACRRSNKSNLIGSIRYNSSFSVYSYSCSLLYYLSSSFSNSNGGGNSRTRSRRRVSRSICSSSCNSKENIKKKDAKAEEQTGQIYPSKFQTNNTTHRIIPPTPDDMVPQSTTSSAGSKKRKANITQLTSQLALFQQKITRNEKQLKISTQQKEHQLKLRAQDKKKIGSLGVILADSRKSYRKRSAEVKVMNAKVIALEASQIAKTVELIQEEKEVRLEFINSFIFPFFQYQIQSSNFPCFHP